MSNYHVGLLLRITGGNIKCWSIEAVTYDHYFEQKILKVCSVNPWGALKYFDLTDPLKSEVYPRCKR